MAVPTDLKSLERYGVYAILLIFIYIGSTVYNNFREDAKEDSLRIYEAISEVKEKVSAMKASDAHRAQTMAVNTEKADRIISALSLADKSRMDFIHNNGTHILVRLPNDTTVKLVKEVETNPPPKG